MEILENNITSEPFRFKPEDLKSLEKRICEVQNYITNGRVASAEIPKEHPWNLSGKSTLGGETYLNTSLSLSQFCMALIMSRHPLIESLNASSKGFNFEKYFLELEKQQILSGLKLLDIGCGSQPVFARMSRALGASVFTVDRIGADKLYVIDSKKNSKEQVVEQESHIQVDMHSENATKVIKERSGGDFNLVSACLFDGLSVSNKEAGELLQVGGILHTVLGRSHLAIKTEKGMFED